MSGQDAASGVVSAPRPETQALKDGQRDEGDGQLLSEGSADSTQYGLFAADKDATEITSAPVKTEADGTAATSPADAGKPEATPAVANDIHPLRQSYREIATQFGWLGWGAFGGPSAHIGLFQKVFVEKRKWLSAQLFLELLALCQFMPGPTSTQQAYAMGVTQQGVTGGFVSGFLFQFPGLLIASLAGWGAAKFLRDPADWLIGLTSGGLAAAGVALVASAAKGLTQKTCKDKLTMSINAAAAIITYYAPKSDTESVERLGVGKIFGALLVVLFATILITSIVVRTQLNYRQAKVFFWFEAMWRIGSLIFGGGQVVLPMLASAFVTPGWMTSQEYFTGIALIQAMPGPLFNISAYIGAVIAARAGVFGLIGIIVCWVGINGPGLLLLYGLLPWWGSFRRFSVYRRWALPELNAAAVGLIVAAVFPLGLQIYFNSPFPNASLCIGIIGYCMVDFLNVPAPLAVLAGGVLGVIGWAAKMN